VIDMALVVQESLRGLFYAPYYAALALGTYEQEGVEVRFVSAATPGQAPDGLFAGTVDVAWGGPMRVNQMYEERADCDLVCFAEAVTRDPFMLIGREPQPDFRLESLRQARIATVSEVPTPWLCLQEDLRRAGIDPATLRRVADATMPDNMAALRAGALDVVQLFQPLAEELIASGEGHLWYAAADRGPCSYTSFYARRGTLAAKRGEMLKLVRALYRTQKWLHLQSPDALASVVAPYFPAVSRPLLVAALSRYYDLGIWGRDPTLPRGGYDRLVAGLVSGGFVRGVPLATAVDNSLAERAIADNPPPVG
jgi:NitT/TauT family transport system substrate-binding protein